MKHTFSTRAKGQSKKTPGHKCTIEVADYATASEAIRLRYFQRGRAGFVIDCQSDLRAEIGKGLRGDALNRKAQEIYDAKVAGVKLVQRPPYDASKLPAMPVEIRNAVLADFERQGFEIVNDPRKVAAPAPAAAPAAPAKPPKGNRK